MTEDEKAPEVNEEQVLYAKVLEVGMYIGLAILFVTFALYVLGIVEPAVPLQDLPGHWTVSAGDYLEAVNRQYLHRDHVVTGWAWLSLLWKADYLNFLGIAVLSAVTILCFLAIIPTLLRKKDRIYASMALLEAMILALAASGILAVGH